MRLIYIISGAQVHPSSTVAVVVFLLIVASHVAKANLFFTLYVYLFLSGCSNFKDKYTMTISTITLG